MQSMHGDVMPAMMTSSPLSRNLPLSNATRNETSLLSDGRQSEREARVDGVGDVATRHVTSPLPARPHPITNPPSRLPLHPEIVSRCGSS